MDKRLAKQHQRQVARAKMKKETSEPDVRTPEEIKAAREASRADNVRGTAPKVGASSRPMRGRYANSTGSAAKTDG